MRIAYFGGSFDPPHEGHLRIARVAAQRLGLDRVLLAPAGRQPLKSQHGASFAERLRMVELLLGDDPQLLASAADAPLPDAPNYAVETLARLRRELPARIELFFLAGADSFLTLPQWRSPEVLLNLPEHGGVLDGWILAARPGFPLAALAGALPVGYALGGRSEAPGPLVTETVVDSLGRRGTPLHLLPDFEDSATATRIREALAAGESALHMSPAVERFIRKHGLYGARGK